MRGQVERDPGATRQQAGVLEIAEPVGEHPGGDHDQHDRGPVEEHPDVHPDRPVVQQPAQRDRGRDADRGTGQRRGRLPGRAGRRPQEQRGLQALAAHREERGEGQRPGADESGAPHLAAQVRGETGRGAPHPEDHPGDQAHGEHAEQAADRLLRPARQIGDRERQDGGEAARQHHRAEHAQPYRRGRHPAAVLAVRWRGLAHRGEQYAHHQAGLKALAQPDQQVRNAVCPSHEN